MKKRKTYAAVMLAAGLLSLLGCATAFADAEGFSEEYSRFRIRMESFPEMRQKN